MAPSPILSLMYNNTHALFRADKNPLDSVWRPGNWVFSRHSDCNVPRITFLPELLKQFLPLRAWPPTLLAKTSIPAGECSSLCHLRKQIFC